MTVTRVELWIGPPRIDNPVKKSTWPARETDKMLMIEAGSGEKRVLKDHLMVPKSNWKNDGSTGFISYWVWCLPHDEDQAEKILTDAVNTQFEFIQHNFNNVKKGMELWQKRNLKQ